MSTSRSNDDYDDYYAMDNDEVFIYDSSSDDDSINTHDESNQFFATLLTDIMGAFASNLGFSNFYHTNPNNLSLMFASTLGLPLVLSAIISPCNKIDSKNVAIVGITTGIMNIASYHIGLQLGFQPLAIPNVMTAGFLISCFAAPLIQETNHYQSFSNHFSSFWRRTTFRGPENLEEANYSSFNKPKQK